MADSTTESIVIAAAPEAIVAVITDFSNYPQWASAIKQADVVEEYEDGYASQVTFTIDAGVLKDSYTLKYSYSEDVTRIEWTLVEPSQVQKSQDGVYDVEDNGDGTSTVTYTLAVELTIPMLGMFKRKAEKVIIDTALKELKKQVEGKA
ncbi:MAG: SRPBCC family protein [Micromonosporaceae bacterium]